MSKNNFILLAEDDEDDQDLIRMAFSRVDGNYDFEIVNNGQAVLDALTSSEKMPCLIILDLNMPKLNGLQTLIALTNDPKFQNVPKVILTTSDNDDNKRKSLSHGAADYFVKPASMKDLVATAQRMLTYCK